MNYQNNIQIRIEKSKERVNQRTKLWKKLCAAYEIGGIQQVKETIEDDLLNFEKRFNEILEELEKQM